MPNRKYTMHTVHSGCEFRLNKLKEKLSTIFADGLATEDESKPEVLPAVHYITCQGNIDIRIGCHSVITAICC